MSARTRGTSAAVLLLCLTATTALGKALSEGHAHGPVDDTWQYLVDLFRMLLGM
ncbi:MAG: hypothetical protein IPJ41_04315 [Phycisphaerales bacterium]|nr:hypothetical protein [Phycisphaerales bacterium]